MQKPNWKQIELSPDLTNFGYYVGISGCFFESWMGNFNPLNQTKPEVFRFYQDNFSFAEIYHTFTEIPSISTFVQIEKNSKEWMKYTVWVHRDISHTQMWDKRAGKATMKNHMVAIGPLLETGKFYSFLIQLDQQVYRNQKVLDYLLSVTSEAIGKRIDVHIEFRHVSWHNAFCLQAMKDAGVGICNTEIPLTKHSYPLRAYATTDKGYVRYNGRRNLKVTQGSGGTKYDFLYTEREIGNRVQGQIRLRKKVNKIAVVYNNFVRTQAVENGLQNIRQLSHRFAVSAIGE